MKGIVFNLLAEIVTRDHGEDAWDSILEDAGVDGAYTSVGNYADEDLTKLVAAASKALDLPPDDVVRSFGRNALPLFAETYPHLFAPYTDTRSFVLALNGIIHPEVRKLYPGADVPDFVFETPADDRLLMHYASARKMCPFAEGLTLGAAAHFGERVEIRQPTCMLRGDDECILDMTFSR